MTTGSTIATILTRIASGPSNAKDADRTRPARSFCLWTPELGHCRAVSHGDQRRHGNQHAQGFRTERPRWIQKMADAWARERYNRVATVMALGRDVAVSAIT